MKRETAVLLPPAFLLALTVSLLLAVPLAVSQAAAQGDMRSVRGTVIDKNESPVASAIVHLKNARTMTVRTYITDANGTFRFSGLDPNVDYEQVHAERDNLTSNTRTISSFDSRKEVVVPLKLDREKKKS